MKNIIILFLLLTQYAYTQNRISNGSFEELTKDLSYYDCPSPDRTLCNPFYYNRVVNWLNLYNTPEISIYNHYEGNVCAKLSANSNYFFQTYFVEGIFQKNLNLRPDKVYTISFKYKSINYGILSIILSNVLNHNDATNIPSNSSYPNIPITVSF